jgi:hypothetical protein
MKGNVFFDVRANLVFALIRQMPGAFAEMGDDKHRPYNKFGLEVLVYG